MKPHPFRLLIPAVALLAVAGARAQDQHALSAAEQKAFEAKSQGRYAEARDAFWELATSPVGDDERSAALHELHASVARLLAERTGAIDLRARLAELADRADVRAHPMLRDALLLDALDLDRSAGDLGATVEHTQALGFLSHWWIVGPFDNERGAGYAQSYDPERGFDPEGSYEGKKRPVRWRQLPVSEPPAGIVDLDAMVRPNDQVLCYAAVALKADQDGAVALHLGSDEAFQVFLNGKRIAGRDVTRPLVADQDAVVLDLKRGPNLLLLKICEGEGAFGFCARLRRLDGSPVEGVTESDAVDDLVAASQVPPAEPAKATAARGALDEFTKGADDGSAADAFRLALILLLRQSDDQTDRRDRHYAELAVQGMPDVPSARYLLAATRSTTGRAEEKDENTRRHDYETLLAKAPDEAEALVALGEMDLESIGAAERAESLARRALKVDGDFGKARLLLSKALDRLELQPLADRELERAAAPTADGHRNPEALADWTDRLVKRGDWTRLDAPLQDLLAEKFEWSTIDRSGRLLLRHGDRDAWIALLERAERTLPFDKEPRERLMHTYEAGGDPAKALSVLQDWLEICPEDDDALVDAARIHGLLGETDRQVELLRQALDLNPNRKAEARLLEFLESDAKPFYEAYELDADQVIAADKGAPPDAAEANDADQWMLQQDVVRAYKNGTTSVYHHRIVRILNDAGARRFARWFVPHYYGEQRARLLSLRVIKPDGTEQRPRLSGSSAQLPPLEPGDVLDVRSRVDDTAPTFFGDYFGLEHEFTADDGAPVSRSELGTGPRRGP